MSHPVVKLRGMKAQVTTDVEFATTLVRGLVHHGPFEPSETDLSLELALSAWLRWHRMDVEDAKAAMIDLRSDLLNLGGLSAKNEPTPLLGCSAARDVVTLAHEVGRLLARCAREAECHQSVIVQRVAQHIDSRHRRGDGAAANQ
jgi:hypothetical protein